MRRYVAEFKVEGGTQEQQTEARETNQVVEKQRTFDSKTLGKVLTGGVAATLTASRIYAQYESASNSIVGDTVAQRQFDNKMAYLNEGLSVFGSLGIAAVVNPATVGLVAVGLAVNYTMRAYQNNQENRVKQASFYVENIVNQQYQNRLVKDITGIRI